MPDAPRAWLQAIADNAADAIIVLDRARIIRYANPAAARLADARGPADITDTSYDKILSRIRILDERGMPPDPAKLPTRMAFAHGTARHGTVVELIRGGVHRWISVSCTPLKNDRGETEHAIVYFSDISESKHNDDKLRFLIESSKMLSITADFNARLTEKIRPAVPSLADWATVNVANPDGSLSRIAIVHRDPGKAPLVEELATLSAREMDPQVGIYGVFKKGEPQISRVVTQDFLKKGRVSDRRLALARELKVCSSIIAPIFSQGSVVGVLSVAFAESDRHYTEKDLVFFQEFCNHLGILIDNARLYEEVSKRDAAKDTFLATLSHELRNPLAPIRSHLELLQLQTDDPTLREEVQVVERQFRHLTKLLNDLLDVSRYTLGTIELSPERLSLRAVIDHIVASHQPLIRDKKIELAVEFPDADVYIVADATRIEQAITNLLHNAEKFTPAGGRITIAVRAEDGDAAIVVSDTGIGIEPEHLENVFKIEAAGRVSRAHGGLGIGLVLVSHIVRLHGGRVEARSAGRGSGSQFCISLPAAPAQTGAALSGLQPHRP